MNYSGLLWADVEALPGVAQQCAEPAQHRPSLATILR